MPARALLLRLLLIAVLVVDSMGAAAAAARHMGHVLGVASVATQPTLPPPSAERHEKCHESIAAVAASSADHTHHADVAPDGKLQQSEDCCDAAGCGACAHHCPALVLGVAFSSPWAAHSQNVRALASVHAPPPLLHLIRPPIG